MIKLTKGEDARQKIMTGISDITAAVSSTFGPHGNNVMIQIPGQHPHITKDGVTVAKHIIFLDPVIDMGASLIREVTYKTASEVGDGTTTTAIITLALLEGIFKYIEDFPEKKTRDIIDSLKKGEKRIIEEIKNNSVKINDENRPSLIMNVATISANGNEEIAANVTEAYLKAGNTGIVRAVESRETETKIKHENGYLIKSGYQSNAFVNNPAIMSCRNQDAKILISADPLTLTTIPYLKSIFESTITKGHPLLIICDEIDDEFLALLANETNRPHFCVILASGYGDLRFERLYDIAALTGAKVLREQDGVRYDFFKEEYLGSCKEFTAYKDRTIIVATEENSPELIKRVDTLRTILETAESGLIIEETKNRLAVLTGGIVTINIGANTSVEMKEKKDLYDDAVLSVKAALNGGVVPGGGATLFKISHKLNEVLFLYLRNAIEKPFLILLSSANIEVIPEDLTSWIENKESVINILSRDKFESNFIKSRICDPADVVISCVKNSISIATTVISTEYTVAFE